MVRKVEQPEVETPERQEEIAPVQDAAVEVKAFQYFDRRDEEQVVAELQGRYLEEFVYEFQQGARKIVGLSYLGVTEAAREYGKNCGGIKTELVSSGIEEGEYVVMVKGLDGYGNERFGIGAQPKKMKVGGGYQDDPFYRQKALSKAQRNAIRTLLPQTLIRQWIEEHRTKKTRGKKNTNPPQDSPPSGGASSGSEAPTQAQIDRLKELMENPHILTEQERDQWMKELAQHELTKNTAGLRIRNLEKLEQERDPEKQEGLSV